MNDINEKELQEMISAAVDEGVKKATHKNRVLKTLGVLLGYAILLCGIWFIYDTIRPKAPEITPLEDHDVTLENNGIFGFKAADFEDAVLGFFIAAVRHVP